MGVYLKSENEYMKAGNTSNDLTYASEKCLNINQSGPPIYAYLNNSKGHPQRISASHPKSAAIKILLINMGSAVPNPMRKKIIQVIFGWDELC